MPEPTPRHARASRRARDKFRARWQALYAGDDTGHPMLIERQAKLGGQALDDHAALAAMRDEGRQLVERLAERAGNTVTVRTEVVVRSWVVVDRPPSRLARLVYRVRFSALAQALDDLGAALAGAGALWLAQAHATSDHEYARGYEAGRAAAAVDDPTGVVSMNARRAAMGLPVWDEGIRCGHTRYGFRCQYDAWHDGGHIISMPRCGAELGGDRCDHRAGHPGAHSTARAVWEVS